MIACLGEDADSRICPTCPYKWIITQQISMRTHLERKQVDDVLGGDEAWANVDQTDGELCEGVIPSDPFPNDAELTDSRLPQVPRISSSVLPSITDSICRRTHDHFLVSSSARTGALSLVRALTYSKCVKCKHQWRE